jgi:FtsZ-binding cell division protein ZapB
VIDPLFWLGLSILLVAVSLAAVLVAALPAFRELARAARSAEKLFDTLSRELPPTLESIRLTSLEITDLKADVSEGVQGAGQVVQQLDQSISGVKKQAQQAQKTTRSFMAGFKAAWRSLSSPQPVSLPATLRSASGDSDDDGVDPLDDSDPLNHFDKLNDSDSFDGSDSFDSFTASPETPEPELSDPPIQLPTKRLN